MTSREQRRVRKQWRKRDKTRRDNSKILQVITSMPPPPTPTLSSGNRQRGRRQVLKNRSKTARECEKLKMTISELQNKILIEQRKYWASKKKTSTASG